MAPWRPLACHGSSAASNRRLGMTRCGVLLFDGALQTAKVRHKAILCWWGGEGMKFAVVAFHGTLQTLRDRKAPNSSAHLGAQLPRLARGLPYEGRKGEPLVAPSSASHERRSIHGGPPCRSACYGANCVTSDRVMREPRLRGRARPDQSARGSRLEARGYSGNMAAGGRSTVRRS